MTLVGETFGAECDLGALGIAIGMEWEATEVTVDEEPIDGDPLRFWVYYEGTLLIDHPHVGLLDQYVSTDRANPTWHNVPPPLRNKLQYAKTAGLVSPKAVQP